MSTISAQYTGYNPPKYDSICVAMCFFNPIGYKSTIRNIEIIIEEFNKYNIPFYVIELLYPNQNQKIKDSFVVKSNSVMFSKENLWNILENKIPDKYEKIVFMDSDILYSDPDWLNKTFELLEKNQIVQSMEWCYKNIYEKNDLISFDSLVKKPEQKETFAKIIKNKEKLNFLIHHCGYNIAFNRDFFKKINGFFEHCVTGSGDAIFWSCFVEDLNLGKVDHFHPNLRSKYLEYKDNIKKLYQPPYKVDYVKDCVVLHFYHGSLSNRQYATRQKYIPKQYNYYHNKDGVLEIEIIEPNEDQLINYWISREEDE